MGEVGVDGTEHGLHPGLGDRGLAADDRPLSAAALRQGFSETVIASGFVEPTAMAVSPDGRIFVAQQGGVVRVV